MAARKLKFKPKPVVGVAVRRPREKEEILPLKNQELNAKPKPSHENILSNIEVENNQNSSTPEYVASEGNVPKRLKIDETKFELDPPVDNSGEVSDLSPSLYLNSVKESTKTTKATSQDSELNTSNLNKKVNLESVSTQSNESCMRIVDNPTDDKPNDKTNLCLNSEENFQSSLKLSPESGVSVQATEKIEVSKGLRFGRSKFKPVLNNNVLRNKPRLNNITVDQEDTQLVSTFRNESVIKCLKSDTTNSRIVSEISDSFSALEEDETNVSEGSLLQRDINEFSHETFRFNTSNADVNTSIANKSTIGHKNFMVSNKKPVTSTIRDSESNTSVELCNSVDQSASQSHQVPASIRPGNTESVNSIVLSPSATKVPTSPLKLTSKILVPKPSPNLLDTTVRRISFHGSDSEEETKRKISLNNDKCTKQTKKEKEAKNNKRKISQGSNYSKLGQEALEKFTQKFGNVQQLDPPDKAKLTMLELIFYNPKSNPMTVTEKTGVGKKEDKIEESGIVKETLAEQSVDDVEEVEAPAPAVPVPQLKVGPDGQIMLDPKSLVIETTEVKEKRAEMEKSEIIRETGITRYNTYSKKKHTRRDWTAQETLQFYKALNTIGSDFTLMTKLFPKRSRHELKLKFKKEEKINMKLVDKAMTAPADFDFRSLEEEMQRENELIAKLEEEKRLAAEAAKKAREQRKEENKKNKVKNCPKTKKGRAAAFKDFDETETEQMKTYCPKPTPKKKKRVAKKKQSVMLLASSSDEEDIPITIDIDSDEADLEESELKLLKLIREKTRVGLRKGRTRKQAKKLEEYEEINETLKKKLEEIDSEESDGYIPNGPGADMLFGSPLRDPLPETSSQEGDDSQWSMEAASMSKGNTQFVDVEELESLGQSNTDLKLPLHDNSSVHRNVAQESDQSQSVLNRRLISESIQIIDQLTSNEHLNESENTNLDKPNENIDQTKKKPCENETLLPSFESASFSQPLVNSQCETYLLNQSGTNSKTDQINNELIVIADQQLENSKNLNEIGIILDEHSGSNECILGE